MDWNKYILFDEGEAEGGGEGEGGGEATVSFAEVKLDGDIVPEKLRGKTGADLLSVYTNAEKKIAKLSADLKAAKETKPADNGETAPASVDFTELMAAATQEGKFEGDLLTKAAEGLGADPDDLQLIARLVHGYNQQLLTRAEEALAEGDDGAEVDVKALIATAESSGIYTQDELAAFDILARKGSVEPFRIMLKDLNEAGIDIESGGAPDRKGRTGMKLPKPEKGLPGMSGEPAGFKSRAEYLSARRDAEVHKRKSMGDESKINEVEARLRKSKIAAWPDRGVMG